MINKAVEEGRDKRRRVLVFVHEFIEEHGYSPTKQEIATHLGVEPKVAAKHVNRLVAEGHLTQGPGPRTIRLTK